MSKTTGHFLVAALLAIVSLSAGAENYSQWSYFRDITINTTAPALSIDSNQVVKFPLLVRLSPADSFVFNTAKNNGADIRFSKFNSPGNSFPYQIEYWDKTYKQAAIWVLVDTVKKSTIAPVARMYWGKAAAGDSSKGSAVFDTVPGRGFQAVFHMNEPNLGDTIYDATLNRFKGMPFDSLGAGLPANKVGKIGLGKEFFGSRGVSGSCYRILNTASGKLNFDTASAYSISAWVNIDSFNVFRTIVSKCQYSLFASSSGNLSFSEVRGGPLTTLNNNKFVQNKDSVSLSNAMGTWRHIVGVHKPGPVPLISLYVDGVLASDSVLTGSTAARNPVLDVRIGFKPDNRTSWFDGVMDEVRMENVARTKDWIKLCYATQKNDTTLNFLGPCTVMPPTTLRYPVDSLSLKKDSALATVIPSFTGVVDSFIIAGLSTSSLPAGLSFNSSNGALSGTPTAATSPAKFVVTAVNSAGTAKDTISILVVAPPVAPAITSQSGAQWVGVASKAVFWVKAAGTAPLTYAWKKNGADVTPPHKDTLTLDTARKADDGAVYNCSVTNSAGTVASAGCTLHVVTAAFNATPVAGFDTLTVAFSDSSSGTSPANPVVRTWRFGDGDSSTALSPSHFYSKPGAYTAKLFVSCRGITDSMSKTISVKNSILSANFKADTLFASGLLKVTFTDSAKGTVFSRKWFFGDGAAITDTGKRTPVTHTYDSIGSYSVKLIVEGPSGSDSLLKSSYIAVRPVNPIKLKVRPVSGSSILLTWDQVSDADSIQIVYTPVKAIPRDTDIVPADIFSSIVPVTAVSDTISGLKSMVQYYFGARVYFKGFWSFFTDSSTNAGKLFSDTDVVVFQPEISLSDISVDSGASALTLRWKTDTTSKTVDSMEVGVFWSTQGFRTAGPGSIDSIKPDTIKKAARYVDSLSLKLGEALSYDTTYYFTVLLRQSGKPWFPLSDSAKRIFRTPEFIRENVKYGVDRPIIFADNKRVRISINAATFSTGNDDNTIARWKRPATLPGFIPVSEGFEFLSKYQSSPLNIGVKYAQPPQGTALDRVKMYRFKNGQWFLERSPQWRDSAEGYVGVTTGDIAAPFIAMIDTLRPVISMVGRLDSAVSFGEPVDDEFVITDNIANASWNFQYAKGGFAFDIEHSDTGIFSKSENRKTTFIPGGLVSADQGVRAIMAISDGINTTYLNVSRKVIRKDGSQVTTTDSMKWVPLFVTSQLDSPEARKVLRTLSGGQDWTYDNTKFRLFRWYSFGGNTSNDTDKYIEYSSVSDSLFSFVPGRLLWIKTRQSRAVNFGRGITLDLTTPYSVTLQAKSWTDISVPFKFNITVGDVLDSTMAGKHSTDSLRICKWTQNTIKNYMLDEVFYSDLGVKALQDKSAVFEGDQTDGIGAGYSIYNPFDEDVPCSFPPIPAAMSGHKQGAAKRTGGTGDGAIVIGAKTADGAVLNTLYCALASGKTAKRFFPAAPSLSGAVTLRVCDEHMRQFGHVAAVGAWEKDEGMSCPLSVSNHGATSDVVTISASGASGLPEGVRFMIFDPVASSFAEPGKDGVLHAQVKVAAGETGVVQLIAGGGGYCAKVKQAALTMKTELIGMYSNPFKRAVRIRFGLPFGFMGKVSFSLFDATGRKVWNSSIPGHSGINDLIWAGNSRTGRQVHTGVYVLQMKAFNAQGGQLGKFEKKLTYMP